MAACKINLADLITQEAQRQGVDHPVRSLWRGLCVNTAGENS